MLISRLVRRVRSDDRGAALAAVIGLMATGLLLTALVTGSVVSAMGFSSSTRAGVQAQAAAEAGIAAARAGLISGTCSAQPTHAGAPAYLSAAGTAPEYVATIWSAGASGTWVAGCPIGTSTQVRILSTGYATAVGIGDDSRDEAHLEAVLSSAGTPTTIIAGGPAIYAYNAGSFGNGGELVSLDGTTPEVIVATGNVTCDNNFQATANLVVNGGNLNVDNGCDISGNVWASGTVSFLNSGEVGGYAVGNGVSMANSSKVTRVWSSAYFSTSGNITVSGGVKAQSMTLGGGTVGGSSYIYGTTNVTNAGATNLSGTVLTQAKGSIPNSWSGNAKITVQNPITSPTYASDLPASPIIPTWIDFGSNAAHFTTQTWNGFTFVTMGSDCGQNAAKAAIESLSGAPGVIDGRNCSGAFTMGNNTNANAYNDVAIIADKIAFSNQATITAVGAERRLWLINPDPTADGVPTCSTQSLMIDNNAQFKNFRVMMYSPCTVTSVAGIVVKGQIFSGSTAMTNNSELHYTAVGLPGYDLNTGSATNTTTPTEGDRTLVSLRNVTAGN
jgi:hypothetical protein